MSSREHWESVYSRQAPTEVSWYQSEARVSLDLIQRAAPDVNSPIIDVGGGDSTLVDGLLDAGYRDICVLDVAAVAIARARERLGDRAAGVGWITADVLRAPLAADAFAVWHDRAVFHFLTNPADRARYVAQVRHAVRRGGHVIVASFAPEGPARCSGLDVVRYSPDAMLAELGPTFQLLDSVREDHHTPSGAIQAFVYCLYRVEAGVTDQLPETR